MATRYFPQNTDVDTGCTAGAADGDHDLSQTQGTTTVHTSNVAGVTTYTEVRSYQVDVTGDSPVTGSLSYSCSIDIAVLSKCDVRFRLRSVDDTGCTRTSVSGYQEYLTATGAGIKTFSLTLDFTAADEDLELVMEAREESGSHGGRTIDINVQDADTWVDAPWPAAGGSKQVNIS